MSFPRYPKYKDSGVEWLGEVPEHWTVCRTDSVLGTCRSTINSDALSGQTVFHYSIPVVQETGDGQLEDGTDIDSGKLVVSEPQVLVSKLNPRKGTVCIAHPREVLTVCSSEFVPLLPRSTDIRFVWYVVQSDNYRTRLESLVESATKSHQRAAPSDIYRLMWAFPPQSEQPAIASFLDRETAKIDALIAEQQRLIELLQEKRQAVISHAVTKGLNPDVPIKDSGIEWLGEVPEHWGVVPLKRLAAIQTGVAKGKDNSGKATISVPYLRVANVQDGYLDLSEVTTIDIPSEELKRYSLRAGDVLMNEGGDFDKLGRGCIWQGQLDPCITQNHVFAVRPRHVSSEWLNAITGSRYAQFYFMSRSKQSTNLASISSTNLMELPVIVPPNDEQSEILAFMARQAALFVSLTTEATQAISLLQERRSALISAAVTGQIDVRGLAGSEAA